jgi:hypothetical protein
VTQWFENDYLKISLEVDGRGPSPYSQIPTCDPTQRLRGNPITLNLYLYNGAGIYIITDPKNSSEYEFLNVSYICFTAKLLMASKYLIEI